MPTRPVHRHVLVLSSMKYPVEEVVAVAAFVVMLVVPLFAIGILERLFGT